MLLRRLRPLHNGILRFLGFFVNGAALWAACGAVYHGLARTPALADLPRPGQISFQDPATLIMVAIVDLHHHIMFWLISTAIVVGGFFVTDLLFFYLREQVHSLRSSYARLRLTDHHGLELFWTVMPMIVVYFISVPSISLLYGMDEDANRAEVDMTVKVIGRQWYWSYEMDEFLPSSTSHHGGNFAFGGRGAELCLRLMAYLGERGARIGQQAAPLDVLGQLETRKPHALARSYQIIRFAEDYLSDEAYDALVEKFHWTFDSLLGAWNRGRNAFNALKMRLLDCQWLALPLKRNVQFLITSEDVIHSWALPSAGIKTDALPGRINGAVCAFFRQLLAFGQCSEICGPGHGFMPISVLVLVETFLAHSVADSAELTLSIVERYKASHRTLVEMQLSADSAGSLALSA